MIGIKDIKNYEVIYIGDFRLREDWLEFFRTTARKDIYTKFKNFIKEKKTNIIKVNYDRNIKQNILKKESARLYFFTLNERIVKIGGSINKGGIIGTLNFYENSLTGSPGRPRFIIHLLIAEQLIRNEGEVKIYLSFLPTNIVNYRGFFKDVSEKIEISEYKIFERRCLDEYKDIVGKYPDWNFQENKDPYPKKLEEIYNFYQKMRLKKRL